MTTTTTPSHEFTLILSGDWEAALDDLFEAGCDDALFGEVDGVPHARFDREAETFSDALESAIAAVEGTGLQVLRIEPDDLVTTAEIAARLGRSPQSVQQLATGARGKGDFPAPVVRASSPTEKGRARLWRWVDVVVWADGDEAEQRVANTIAALNAALEVRRLASKIDPDAQQVVFRIGAAPPGARLARKRRAHR